MSSSSNSNGKSVQPQSPAKKRKVNNILGPDTSRLFISSSSAATTHLLRPAPPPGVSSGKAAIDAGRVGNNVEMSFDNFPYYLSEKTKDYLVGSYLLRSMHKEQTVIPKLQYTGRVLLSGPEGSEFYQEKLAMALSEHFRAKLLVLDCPSNLSGLLNFRKPYSKDALRFYVYPSLLLRSVRFSHVTPQTARDLFVRKSFHQELETGDRVIYTGLISRSRGPKFGNCGKIMCFRSKEVGVMFDRPILEGNNLGDLCGAQHGFFCDVNEVCIDFGYEDGDLFTPQGSFGERRSIVFMKRALNCLVENGNSFSGMNVMVNVLPDNIFVIGSHIQEEFKGNFDLRRENEQRFQHASKRLCEIFPDSISIEMPEDKTLFDKLKTKLDRVAELLKVRENESRLLKALSKHGLGCKHIDTLNVKERKLTDAEAEKVVKWALGQETMALNPLIYSRSPMILSRESMLYGLNNLWAIQTKQNNSGTFIQGIAIDHDYEKMILEDVNRRSEIGVKFDEIGALDNIKDALKEIFILPLQRAELFCNELRKPCRGILLFGPSGTGKTMLAKAIATEAGATFLNISLSNPRWFVDVEKSVNAIFSLASKKAPSVLFIDEADNSIFGRRKETEHELTRKVKYEFMRNWDGLLTKDAERVIVLASTSRPFDLDEAAVRRMPRRFLVNLPDITSRCEILQVILAKEHLSEDVDLNAIARMTDDFSGCDLKNLCVAAAHRPVIEMAKKDKGKSIVGTQPEIRPLNMQDFRDACKEVRASVSSKSTSVTDVLRWNELFGDGGARPIAPPSYYI